MPLGIPSQNDKNNLFLKFQQLETVPANNKRVCKSKKGKGSGFATDIEGKSDNSSTEPPPPKKGSMLYV